MESKPTRGQLRKALTDAHEAAYEKSGSRISAWEAVTSAAIRYGAQIDPEPPVDWRRMSELPSGHGLVLFAYRSHLGEEFVSADSATDRVYDEAHGRIWWKPMPDFPKSTQ